MFEGDPKASFWPRWRENKLFTVLLAIFLIYGIIFLGTLIQNNIKKFFRIGRADISERVVIVSGEGKIVSVPNIASVSIGLVTEKQDVFSAQKENSEKMNALIAAIKELGVASADIQTAQYQIYPRYDYTEGKSTLAGYSVSQNVAVKIRDLTKVSSVLERAGLLGANQVSGLTFTIDDPKALAAEARSLAIMDAKVKAASLSRDLKVRLTKIVAFSESSGPMPPPGPIYAREGFGGGIAPQIESGSAEVVSNAMITYEIE